ncbi:MAG: HK97 gp10 family phage protein [Veillonella sp.]|nr:HK97 gp10 family phage protein [Veillonella sp.]
MINSNRLTVTPDLVQDAVNNLLDQYGDDVFFCLDDAVETIGKETAQIVKEKAPVETGKSSRKGRYKKSISFKKDTKSKNLGEVRGYVYAKYPESSLAHLLEFPHAKANGTGTVSPQPHFQYGQDHVNQNFQDQLKKTIEEV